MLSSRVSADWRCIWRTRVSRGMDRLAVSARFPRDVTGSPPRVGAGDRMFPREPFMRRRSIAKIAPKRASGSPVSPCGLVCEVMARRWLPESALPDTPAAAIAPCGGGPGPVCAVRAQVQAEVNPRLGGACHHVAVEQARRQG